MWHSLTRAGIGGPIEAVLPSVGRRSMTAPSLLRIRTNDDFMIRVIQCVNSLAVGGLEQLVVTLAARLKAEGFKSEICCLEERGALAETTLLAGVPVYHLESPAFKWKSLRQLCARLRSERPCVIHSHNFKPFYYASLARMIGAVDAHVHTRHGAFTRVHRAHWRYRLLRRWADDLVTVSQQGRAQLAEQTGLSLASIGVLPNGVDLSEFEPAVDKASIRRELEVSPGVLAVINVARQSAEKDLPTLLRAFAIILRERPGCELWLVGDGAERNKLESLAVELKLGSRARFWGTRTDVNRLLRAADVFALSSLSEGLSVALIEAAASGLPIVATDVGGNSEIVNPPKCGRTVPPRSPERLAEALLEVLGDEELRARLGGAGRQRAVEYFGLDKMVSRYAEMYRRVLH